MMHGQESIRTWNKFVD